MPKPDAQILICVNERDEGSAKPSCGRRDGLAVYQRCKDRLRELGLRDRVIATRTGCLKHCSRGVTVAVWPDNLWYGGVHADDVDEILQETVVGGREVERLRMPPGDWE